MTEAEWLAGTDPTSLLSFAASHMSERQRLLFCVACCRRIWFTLNDDRLRQLVERAEEFADGSITREELQQAYEAPLRPGYRLPVHQEEIAAPLVPGEPAPVPFRAFHFGRHEPPLRVGMGTINFHELPEWARHSFWAALDTGDAEMQGAAARAASTAAEYAADQGRETHAHHKASINGGLRSSARPASTRSTSSAAWTTWSKRRRPNSDNWRSKSTRKSNDWRPRYLHKQPR